LKKIFAWFFGFVIVAILILRLGIDTIDTQDSSMKFRYTSETTNLIIRVVTVEKVLEGVERVSYFNWIDLVVVKSQFRNVDIENIWS